MIGSSSRSICSAAVCMNGYLAASIVPVDDALALPGDSADSPSNPADVSGAADLAVGALSIVSLIS